MSKSRTSCRRTAIGLSFLLVAGFSTSLVGGPASAAVRVYSSTPGIPRALPIGSTTFDVFITNGGTPTSAGTSCFDGNGDELCGYSVDLQATGDVAITSFSPVPSSGTVWRHDLDSVRVNGVSAIAGRLGPERIGTLNVAVSGVGSIRVVPGSLSMGVRADLAPSPIAATTVALPEPGARLGLGIGILALAAIARRVRSDGNGPRDRTHED